MNDSNWPIEEAGFTVLQYQQTCEDFPDTPEENLSELKRAIQRMRGVFTRSSAGDKGRADKDFQLYLDALLENLPNIKKDQIT